MAIYVDGKKIAGLGSRGEPGKSAYQQAVEGGYTGTEEDFKSLLADVMPRSEIETQLLNKLGYAGITNDITDTPAEAPQEKRKSGIWLTDTTSVEGTPA